MTTLIPVHIPCFWPLGWTRTTTFRSHLKLKINHHLINQPVFNRGPTNKFFQDGPPKNQTNWDNFKKNSEQKSQVSKLLFGRRFFLSSKYTIYSSRIKCLIVGMNSTVPLVMYTYIMTIPILRLFNSTWLDCGRGDEQCDQLVCSRQFFSSHNSQRTICFVFK